jgi:hypothetical protein
MHEYEVTVVPSVVRVFRVTAATPERAAELIAADEPEQDGEQVIHVGDKEHGYDVVEVVRWPVAGQSPPRT